MGASDAPSAFGRRALFILAACWLAHLSLGLRGIERAAPTYDEPLHLASGYSYLATGRYRLNIHDHPPLAEIWAALPLWPSAPDTFFHHPAWNDQLQYHYADLFLYANKVPAEALMNRARRFNLATLSLLLFAGLFGWAAGALGAGAAVAAGALAAFCPSLLAHESLVTTDAASAILFFIATACLWRATAGRGRLAWAGAAGAACGLAMACKFNMLVLPPLLLALLAGDAWLRKERPAVPLALGAVLLACAGAALAAAYKLDVGLYLSGLKATAGRLGEGRASFLAGRYSHTGFPLYFPAAFVLKTTPPELLLGLLGAALAARGPRARPVGLWLLVPPLAYFAAALTSKVQIGHRHLLPVYPFWLLLAGSGAAWLWNGASGERRLAGRALVAVLLAWQAAAAVARREHPLTYFNALAGGDAGGWRWLVDSNVDWGQGLKPLAEELRRRGNPPVYLSYFGCADPEAYGLRYVPFAPVGNVERLPAKVRPFESGKVLVAISATNLQGTYYANHAVFDWLKAKPPAAIAGHSIFLYDLTDDPAGVERLTSLLKAAAGRRDAGLAGEIADRGEARPEASASEELEDWSRRRRG